MLPGFLARFINALLDRENKSLHAKATGGATFVLLVVMLLGSYAEVEAERGAAGANLTSYPKALWWSVETATTVGYGDFFPVTLWGRVVATVVMIAGITTYGVITAAIATLFVGRERKRRRLAEEAEEAEERVKQGAEHLVADAKAMHERFDRLERIIDRGRGKDSP